ncbi:MAG: EAL domain-containing protein [Pseudomonadota bacterium]
MLKLGKQSLSRKLTLIVVASVLGAVCLIAVGSLWQDARRHTQAKLDYLTSTASVFASATSAAVRQHDQPAALVALRGVARAPDLLYARVETVDAGVLAEIGSGVSLGTDARYRAGARVSVADALRSRTLQVTEPIIDGGVTVGRITLVADNSDLVSTLLTSLMQLLLAAVFALGIAILVAARLQHVVVRPLLNLTKVVRHISQSHDYKARVEIESDDEVGELCGGFNTMLKEIDDRERKIIDLALHDPETDLPSRLAFERELTEWTALPRTGVTAVAAVSVDRFQFVRGVIGYVYAADVLAELGARVAALGVHGMAARVSNDVIAFLIQAPDLETAQERAHAAITEAEEPMLLGPHTIDVNVTVGLALYEVHAQTPAALIERANIALDQARAARAKIATFDAEAYARMTGNLSLMTEMGRALHNGEMQIHLQPKYDIRGGAIAGAEVLARWTHPERGRMSPDLFVGMAEETGAIGPLTRWSLRAALSCQGRLLAADVPATLAVNLSGRLLTDDAFVNEAVMLLEEAKAPLYLEITETATIDNQDLALKHVDALVAAGARISIDDYGSGLSSLAYLKRIPAQELKIDKSFVSLLGLHARDALLVKSTVELAHSLGMSVTAEGVETEAALKALTEMGCDTAQGYFIGKPMPELEYIALCRRERALKQRALSAGA